MTPEQGPQTVTITMARTIAIAIKIPITIQFSSTIKKGVVIAIRIAITITHTAFYMGLKTMPTRNNLFGDSAPVSFSFSASDRRR